MSGAGALTAPVVARHGTATYAPEVRVSRLDRELKGETERGNLLPADVLGPQSAPLARLRGQYRFDFLLRAVNAARLLQVLERLRDEEILAPTNKHVLIDVDPVSLL